MKFSLQCSAECGRNKSEDNQVCLFLLVYASTKSSSCRPLFSIDNSYRATQESYADTMRGHLGRMNIRIAYLCVISPSYSLLSTVPLPIGTLHMLVFLGCVGGVYSTENKCDSVSIRTVWYHEKQLNTSPLD
jgi:hypothetical protein